MLRAPFVVTVSTVSACALAAGGCDGASTATTADAAAPDASADAPATCPHDCSVGQPCDTPPDLPCFCEGFLGSVSCEQGIWCAQALLSNPPPPVPGACPDAPPAHGTDCDEKTQAYCYYSCPTAISEVIPSARCQGGKWCGFADATCVNKNPPPCPAVMPASGDPCPPSVEPYECSYPCADAGLYEAATCYVNGTWFVPRDACGAAIADAGDGG